MNQAKRISSAVCYLSGALGLTITQDVSDVLGIILTIVSIVSMVVCLIINLISRIKKASSDGKITAEEIEEIRNEIEKTRKEIENEASRNDKDEKGE